MQQVASVRYAYMMSIDEQTYVNKTDKKESVKELNNNSLIKNINDDLCYI